MSVSRRMIALAVSTAMFTSLREAPGQFGVPITDPVPLNTNASTDIGLDLLAQLATDGSGNWVAVWTSDEPLGGGIGGDPEILIARSTDSGATWSAPGALNTNAATDIAIDASPEIATDSLGNWIAVWESGPFAGEIDILFARSTDNGITWTVPVPLNTNAATDSGNDLRPQLAADGSGNWVAVWHSFDDLDGTIGTERDILVARSADNGVTWTAPAALNSSAATDSAGDFDPQVTTDGSGNWVAVWDSFDELNGTIGFDSDILVARSTDNGVTWTTAVPLNTNAGIDFAGDAQPQIAADGAANWVAVWSSFVPGVGSDIDVMVALSTDKGATWTAPAALNTNAATDAGADVRLDIATDGSGQWVTVWDSTEDFGGTIGTDNDILLARFSLGICGDGVVELPEQCDDGNTDDTDFCLSTCEFNLAIPTVSEWGLIVMSLLVLTAGTLVYARRRPTPA